MTTQLLDLHILIKKNVCGGMDGMDLWREILTISSVKNSLHPQNGSLYFSKFYFKQDSHTFSSQPILEMGGGGYITYIGVSYTTPWGRGCHKTHTIQ